MGVNLQELGHLDTDAEPSAWIPLLSSFYGAGEEMCRTDNPHPLDEDSVARRERGVEPRCREDVIQQ